MKAKLLYGALALWFVGIAAAFAAVWQYKTTPGAAATAPSTWPRASALHPAPAVANVILFAHPQCPCTRASITELSRLAGELGTSAKIHVVIVQPEDTPDEFAEGVIKERAAAIPNVDIVVDHAGVESRRFGAITSGSTVVYSTAGDLVFRGGLTLARGHEGRGPAADKIRELVIGRDTVRAEAPTFGCAL